MQSTTTIEIPRMIGQVTKARREELGLTQQQLADAADVSRPFINRLEKGTAVAIYPEKLFYVLDALGITMLLKVDKKPNPKRPNQKDAQKHRDERHMYAPELWQPRNRS